MLSSRNSIHYFFSAAGLILYRQIPGKGSGKKNSSGAPVSTVRTARSSQHGLG
jgi:hypothetical protein